jgi:hypothetical protein
MSTLHPSDNTLISVIVPFGDPRGRAEHLDSWTQQTLAPERFEIIAVANPQRSNEAAIRERLRPHIACFRSTIPIRFQCTAWQPRPPAGDPVFHRGSLRCRSGVSGSRGEVS